MTEKRFKIIDKQFISYYGGNGHLISNGNCKFWLWHDESESQKVCDKLNIIMEENGQLKETIKELELETAKHIGDGEWDIRDITYGHGKFRLEEWGERYHQFYDDDKALEDEEVVSLLFENEELKKELFESEKDYIMETYSDNPIRRDEKIQSLKEEFKARFGDME